MKILLSLYFFMIAIVQAGLFLGIFHYYRSQNLVKASQYWLSSLFASSAALVVFGVGILGVDDVSRPDFIFTVANLLFFLASLLQTIFCISLSTELPLIIFLLISKSKLKLLNKLIIVFS